MQSEKPQEITSLPAPEVCPPLVNLIPPVLSHKTAREPIPGFARNPLLTLPRNQACPCRSGKKFKRCCLKVIPGVVTELMAKDFAAQMKKPDLVFVTNDNEAKVVAEAKQTVEPEVP